MAGSRAAARDECRRRQQAFYAGGPIEPVAELLAEDVRWHVPGTSPIAGDHRGRAAVLDYFRRRRDLAAGTMRMEPGQRLVSDDVVVELTEGRATLGGREETWGTAGVYRLAGGLIVEAWLVPFDLDLFDRVWSAGPGR